MATMNLESVQANLPQVIEDLIRGEALTITKGGNPVALLERLSARQWPCKAGSAQDVPHWMAPDFNSPLEDFGESSE